MKKLKSTLGNMLLSLFLISSIMAGALALVYGITKKPIAQAEINKVNDAIKEVVPDFNNHPDQEAWKVAVEGTEDSLTLYAAKQNGEKVGTAVSSLTNKAFSGKFTIMVGFLPDGSIYNTKVLSQQETPGLGSKIGDPKFYNQFNGKNPKTIKLSVKNDGGVIDAISGATVSSRAYCDAVQRAYDAYMGNSVDAQSGATQTGGGQ